MNVAVATPIAPARSEQQRLKALERANEIRSHRRVVKIDLKARERSPADVVRSPEPELETMKLYALLLAIPKVGRVKANKILTVAKVSPSKTLGGLSARQRMELLAILRFYGV